MYSSYHRIIKCVGFESIHCATNLDITSSSKVFSEFDYVFLLNVLLVRINKIIFLKKKVISNSIYNSFYFIFLIHWNNYKNDVLNFLSFFILVSKLFLIK